ncbi:Lysophospholipid acyltransferase 5 [Collichthys lucidus]|uniref:Lysophospholipid acyltransferase 5 n=1 Tax=Collichthys lucidus TaxID=240159 RepID=A0A4U5V6U8_COLLU|nr:Lysophospholipid acyltransferase 5 [Collichthys lucidus]
MAAPLLEDLSESLGSPEPAVRLILSILIGNFLAQVRVSLCTGIPAVLVPPARHSYTFVPRVLWAGTSSIQLWLSDLSLRSMHPCPIPDAEAYGKDGNNCPVQLYLSNGEVSWCFLSPLHPGLLYSFSTLYSFFARCQTLTAVVQVYLLAGYYYTATEEYDIKWTMPHCVLTLKLVGLSFDYYDGGKDPSQLSLEQKSAALPSVPSLLEVYGFSYFYGGFLVGPQFTLRSYQKLVAGELTDCPGQPPNSIIPALKRFALGFLCLVIYAIFSPYYPDSYYLTDEYEEGVCILTGLGYNGVVDGKHRWDACANMKVWLFETTPLFGGTISSFNINTNAWAARHVFKRLKFLGNKTLSHVTTLLFLTIWHGLHSGYILCFSMEFFIITVERQALALVRDSPLLTKLANSALYPLIYVVQQFIHWLFMGYPLVPFCLFTYDKWLKVYSSVYFCGHVFFLVAFLIMPYLRKALVPKKERSQMDRMNFLSFFLLCLTSVASGNKGQFLILLTVNCERVRGDALDLSWEHTDLSSLFGLSSSLCRSANKHKPWIETEYQGIVMENDNTVLLNPPLFALDKDAPLHYAGNTNSNYIASSLILYCYIKQYRMRELFEAVVLDRSTGEGLVRSKEPLDCESQREHSFTIQATTAERDLMEATVHVRVNDVNEFSPVFVERRYEASVPEGRLFDRIVRVEALDADCSPQYSQICFYDIITPNVPFAIDNDEPPNSIFSSVFNS